MRIQHFLSRTGIASRRKAEALIKNGLVKVNGKVVLEPFFQVDPGKDKIEFNGKELKIPEEHTYIILNKPRGFVTTVSDEFQRRTVMELIPLKEKGLVPVGRLDKDSEGLLLITNDGDLAHRLTHPSFEIEKEYEVVLSRAAGKELKKMEKGIQSGEDFLRASRVIFKGKNEILVTLKEGKKREIRRMLEALGYGVIRLKRVRLGNLKLSDLEAGKWRKLTKTEISKLKELTDRKI
ncbi:MAG: pseudouridine synthase [Actinomycetota bacterium]|nr:pseudouridine synthase [Actinomycetota bacterium]